ncbi:hypothetical protein RugamoR64_17990 [Duganella rhizosphaerae]|uniref:hypothetical protein n=1 Tax=Duganella rhizosphaerae TaxID=2885763 RepID=UPI0030E9BCF6
MIAGPGAVVLVDAEGRDSAESHAALAAARLALVPLTPEQADLSTRYQLIARLNAARMFNPGLHVHFVLVGEATDAERAAVCAYVAQVMSATLASTVIHGRAPADVASLCREVFTV